MCSSSFLRCQFDHCYYVKRFDNLYIILLLYVDDMLIVGACKKKINELKLELSKKFAMKDLGAIKQILDTSITRDRVNGILKLSQEEYVKNMLNKINLDEMKPVSTLLASHFKLPKEQSPSIE